MKNNHLYDYVNNFTIKNEINMKDEKSIIFLTEYIENIIFNVVSIASIITFINNAKTINEKSITIVKKYLDNMCGNVNSMKGGYIVLPSEFYGINSGNYSATNGIHADVLPIDFSYGIARPQIGGGPSSKKKAIKPIQLCIKDILIYYKLKVSAEVVNKITKMIEGYIKCLMQKLKLQKGKVSSITIKKIIKSNKIFDIFN